MQKLNFVVAMSSASLPLIFSTVHDEPQCWRVQPNKELFRVKQWLKAASQVHLETLPCTRDDVLTEYMVSRKAICMWTAAVVCHHVRHFLEASCHCVPTNRALHEDAWPSEDPSPDVRRQTGNSEAPSVSTGEKRSHDNAA